MNKITLSITSLLLSGFCTAQIKTNAGTFAKPTTGDIITEINFAPNLVGGQGIFTLSTINNDMDLVGIKARKFISDTKAYRAIANLSISNSGEKDANTDFKIGAGLGIENHLKGAERLSTYWGYEGKIGFVSATTTVDTESFLEEEEEEELTSAIAIKTTKFGIAANIFTGFDYYIMPNIYLGAELSYGLAVTNTKEEVASGETKFELAPSVTPFFRLGWKL